jgi:hypothetical protein
MAYTIRSCVVQKRSKFVARAPTHQAIGRGIRTKGEA